MRLWNVHVIYEWGDKKRKRGWCNVLVEAEDGEQAMRLGAQAVENSAPSDRHWTMFEGRSAATTHLPIVLQQIPSL